MTVHEASKLQDMQELKFESKQYSLPIGRCYEALGNAVNVKVVQLIANNLINR